MRLLVFTLLFAFISCSKARPVLPPKESIFRYNLNARITSLDPHATVDVYSATVQSLVYDTLYEYHYLKPQEIIPALAESLPTFSKDRKSLTIKLKRGIFFQDDECFANGKGREITSDDVLFMFERAASPKISYAAFGNFEGNIVGIDD